jgi:hypothetical protein
MRRDAAICKISSQRRNMTLKIATSALLILISGLQTISAHHSYGSFLQDQKVSIEGTIIGILYANPHVTLTIRTNNLNIYKAELQSPNVLRGNGLDRATLHYGDMVTVTGSPKRDPADHTISLVKEIRRHVDGWIWPIPKPVRAGMRQ